MSSAVALTRDCVPYLVLDSERVRAFERSLIDPGEVPGIVLMKRAGRAVFERLCARGARAPVVFCGAGNNGGDGYVVAALARAAGMAVRVLAVGDDSKLSADARSARDWAIAEGLDIERFGTAAVSDGAADVIVDALLGIGVRGAPRGDIAEAIRVIVATGLPVIAVDVPSGLDADTGVAAGEVVRAEETVTFIAPKPGLITGRGPEFCGRLLLADLALDSARLLAWDSGVRSTCWRSELAPPPRGRDAHKGDSGHVLVLGGASGMGGAAILAAEAAMRCGAGLVSVGCASEVAPAVLARRPEVMARGVETDTALTALLERASHLAIGPGLGRDEFGQRLLHTALAAGKPLVVDADALNLLASRASAEGSPVELGPTVIVTPHPAEAARLLGCSTTEVQRDRIAAARALATRWQAVVVLKGAGTVVTDGTQVHICIDGNPGMAVGGMGDVLTGVIAALYASGMTAFAAALGGVCLHARAADLAISDGERGLLASDLLPFLRRLVNDPHSGAP